MTRPTTYRIGVRILALGPAGELLTGEHADVELTAQEYDALDADALVERYTKPATFAAKGGVDHKRGWQH